ncbi:MAG: hypothetical protein CMI53_04420 [Parcubacteria group bacterium]|nr:hypothetical protein [Parcubacteria group bacterium]|tara:strand:- start:15247 stop:15960 length:714 start_codon:yes stop_codon:yes gene_type:complete
MNQHDPFAERHEQIMKKVKPFSSSKLWIHTFIFSIFVFVGGSLYLFARRGDYDLYIANKVFATTALVLMGLSMALSGLCYFWDFVDTKIIYRKHLGVIGFGYAVLHIIVTLFFLPNKFAQPEWIIDHPVSAIVATLALLIFIGMVAISNRHAVVELGSKRWRALMRVGYVAFALVIVHFALLKYNGWIKWIDTHEPFLPPLSLLEVIFGVGVIILRLALWVSVLSKKKPTSSPTTVK